MTDRSHPQMPTRTIATIGFGEAAQAFVKGWSARSDMAISAYDIKTETAATANAKRCDYGAAAVTGRNSLADLLADADIVFSLVTADQAGAAAHAAAAHIRPGAYFFDANSCAPKTKQTSAEIIGSAGGRYVDTAIMAPVHPKLHRVPILLSGPHANAAQAILTGFDMNASIQPGPVGRASSIKMIRSIMVKGLEALTAECLLAARLAGVQDIVLASLAASKTGVGDAGQAAYNLQRMMLHGQRRAAEMREVAITIADLGLQGGMAGASADWQQTIGDLGLQAGDEDLATRSDIILRALGLPDDTPDDNKETRRR